MVMIQHLFDTLALLCTLCSLYLGSPDVPRPLLVAVFLPSLLSFIVNRGRLSRQAILWNVAVLTFDWLYLYGKSSAVTDLCLLALFFSVRARQMTPPLLFVSFAVLLTSLFHLSYYGLEELVSGGAVWRMFFQATLLYRALPAVLPYCRISLLGFWCTALFFTPVYWGEYFYYLHGHSSVLPHPQFFASLAVLACITWACVVRRMKEHLLVSLLLLLLPLAFLLFSPARNLLTAPPIEPLRALTHGEVIFGVPSPREWLMEVAGDSMPEFLMTTVQLLIVSCGVLPLILLVGFGMWGITKRWESSIIFLLLLLPGGVSPLVLLTAHVIAYPSREIMHFDRTTSLEKILAAFTLSASLAGVCVVAVAGAIGARDAIESGCATPSAKKLDLIPDVVLTLLAKEDLMFFNHWGVDPARMKWVVRDFLKSGDTTRGASTITMQLAKVKCLSYEKTALRKVKQLLIAFYLEALYDKRTILNEYISTVPYAPSIVGIEAASLHYFEKHHHLLNFSESLKLAMTIEDPERFNPSLPMTAEKRAEYGKLSRNLATFKQELSEGMMREW